MLIDLPSNLFSDSILQISYRKFALNFKLTHAPGLSVTAFEQLAPGKSDTDYIFSLNFRENSTTHQSSSHRYSRSNDDSTLIENENIGLNSIKEVQYIQ